jgi:hypothetical protein
MSMLRIGTLVLMAMLLASSVTAQEQINGNDPWALVRGLEGVWEGEGIGFGQTSELTHRWQFVLAGHFFRLETRSVVEVEPGEDEVHEDVGYVSWSEGEDVLRFRQFLSEGFVNTFKLEEVRSPRPGINFEPEGTEGMETLIARMTLRFQDAETYEMVLELGAKGEELKPCQTMTLRRAD